MKKIWIFENGVELDTTSFHFLKEFSFVSPVGCVWVCGGKTGIGDNNHQKKSVCRNSETRAFLNWSCRHSIVVIGYNELKFADVGDCSELTIELSNDDNNNNNNACYLDLWKTRTKGREEEEKRGRQRRSRVVDKGDEGQTEEEKGRHRLKKADRWGKG